MDHKELIGTLTAYRQKYDTFKKSITSRPKDMQVVTFDGPPFASGTPHYGHGLVSIMKDTLARFKTMQGYRVERKWGRDCHGLPVEKYVEKQLGLDGKKDIEEKLGVEKFVEACRKTVRNVNSDWKTFVQNIGRRADMDNAYFTMDLDYMESVMRVFSRMYDKNLVYRGFSIQGYCPSCATGLSNSEVNEGYKDRQDPAITVKFKIQIQGQKQGFVTSKDGFIEYALGVIKNEKGEILSLFNKKHNNRQFPGGKIDDGETAEKALLREIKEELGVNATIKKYLGSKKILFHKDPGNISLYEVQLDKEPNIQEHDKHAYLAYAQIVPTHNKRGYQYKINNTIITDEEEIHKYHDLLAYKQITENKDLKGDMYFLARTTTPWTLPSNMFLAVGPTIDYVQIYDFKTEEYYILAEALLEKYYPNKSDYIVTYSCLGKNLTGLHYTPLRDMYAKSKNIADIYKTQVNKILTGDFVTTDNGTGIVHIAPAFGQDDFDIVSNIFAKDEAQHRLFMPINEFGEFTDDVQMRKGTRCYDANKDIIQDLKKNNKIIAQNTINHSYPHCRRCETPLIYKAMTSWFIKEQNIAQKTIPSLDDISFVPESVKNRFRDVLKSAPDRNVSRSRYRGAPIPIRQSDKDDNDRIVIKNLDDLYQHSKTGSKNINKCIFVCSTEGECTGKENKKGKKQTQTIIQELEEIIGSNEDRQIVIGPTCKNLETIYPYLEIIYNRQELEDIKTKFTATEKNYQALEAKNEISEYLANRKNTRYFALADGLSVDFRIGDKKEETIQEYIEQVNEGNETKTIITIADKETIMIMRKICRQFDEETQHEKYNLSTGGIAIHYRDTTRKKEVDLHKPYVDNYRFEYKDSKYTRVPEVFDCWFESGAMPYGQVNYIGDKKKQLQFPAEYIIEGLDQTRGWFRTLHVLGHGVMNKNAFHNILVNGLILAEDGKKMSKKLKNYPEPSYLIEKYGADALRMYLLTSPAVRAEPVRLGESLVEQMYKDFSAPLLNAYNFFATYAQIDNFKAYNKDIHYMQNNCSLNEIETDILIRTNCDIIVQIDKPSPLAKQIQTLLKSMQGKHVIVDLIDTTKDDRYKQYITDHPKKNILMIGDSKQYKNIWQTTYGTNKANTSHPIVPLMTYSVTNNLDRWIISALHNMMHETENATNRYLLDNASKEIMNFIDKLTNRYIRRSRRRFRSSGMDADKNSAYNTLFIVMEKLLRIAAPFAPFISEHIRQQLQKFSYNPVQQGDSIHLEYMPLSNTQYVDTKLLEEIELVRRIISLGLSVRAKNNIKNKQPLQSLSIRIE